MKKYILIVLVALLAVCCTEEKIKTYHGGHYLSFVLNGEKDSTITSFFFYPFDNEINVPVAIFLGGGPIGEDFSYQLEVVSDKSDALSKNFKLETYTFRKGMVQDTAFVKLIRSDELNNKAYTLVLQIKPQESFGLGQKEFRTGKIVFSAKAAQPDWWDITVEKAYLGKYTDTKYTEFMRATNGEAVNFGSLNAEEKHAMAIEFLYYLRDAKENNNPIMDKDKDGNDVEMTIPVVG